MDLTDITRKFHLNTRENTCFQQPMGTFSKTDDILGHKTSTNWNIEMISCIPPQWNKAGYNQQQKLQKVQEYKTIHHRMMKGLTEEIMKEI